MNNFTHSIRKRGWLCIPLFLFVALVLRIAWVCDDAFITFRTIENFWQGYGLRWNIGERVQVYTHPLWMFILLLCKPIFGSLYYTAIFLSTAFSTLAIVLAIVYVCQHARTALFVVVALVVSKAFMDFTTSGLENPLLYFLLTFYFWLAMKIDFNRAGYDLYHGMLVALLLLTRLDALLLCLPCIVYIYWNKKSYKAIAWFMTGLFPLWLWELFSLLYYGFLLPNTAYAKLSHGIARILLIEQGWYYFLNSLSIDAVTLGLMILAFVVSVWHRNKKLFSFAVGIVLYVSYVVWIGGDFMSGRFFTLPYVISVLILVCILDESKPTFTWIVVSSLFIFGIVNTHSPLRTSTYYAQNKVFEDFLYQHEISDERGMFFASTGLVHNIGETRITRHPWARAGLEARKEQKSVLVDGAIGLLGFYAGHEVHIIDFNGLGDAFLARLPARPRGYLHAGHFVRDIPKGYISSIEKGENHLEDQRMAEYYDSLRLVISGKIFSWERLKAIIVLQAGLKKFTEK